LTQSTTVYNVVDEVVVGVRYIMAKKRHRMSFD